MLLLWRQDEGHRCCHGHLLTGPSCLTAGAPSARAARPWKLQTESSRTRSTTLLKCYSRSPNNPALQLLQNSSKSPSAGS